MKTFNLDNEPKIKAGFTTPEGYFNHFSEKIMQQLPEKETKVISIFAKRKTWIYSAVAVFVLGISIPVYNQFNSKSKEIDAAALENYIAYHSSITQTDIVNMLDEKDIDNMSVDLKIDNQSIENELSDNSNIEQYLTN